MFFRWRRLDVEGRRRVWRLYGWYSALMLCGSCIGVATWWAWMQRLTLTFIQVRTTDQAQRFSLRALGHSWRAAFTVTYATEFLCLSVAKLMILDRMAHFIKPCTASALRRWFVAGRVVLGVVVAGNVVSVICSIIAAEHWQRSSEYNSEAASYFAINDTVQATNSIHEGRQWLGKAAYFTSWQTFCEAVVLLLIVLAFVCAGVACVRRVDIVSSALDGIAAATAASTAGQELRLQIVGTTAFIFLTFLLRSVFSTMYAVAYALQSPRSDNKSCALKTLCDAECYNVYSHLIDFIAYKPEFQLTIVLISSPLALLIALWGMTTASTLRIMQQHAVGAGLLENLR
jgi:hypothetical protein